MPDDGKISDFEWLRGRTVAVLGDSITRDNVESVRRFPSSSFYRERGANKAMNPLAVLRAGVRQYGMDLGQHASLAALVLQPWRPRDGEL